MKERYRAGIVGLGFIGGADQVSGDALGQQVENLDGTHFDAYAHHPRIQLVGGSSRDEGRRGRFAAKADAKVFSDWRDMIDQCDLDIVSVATYTPSHEEIVLACARACIPVIYCEKPISNSVPSAEAMVSECHASGSLLVINHNRRFSDNYRRLRSFLADGNIGDLTSATLRWGAGRLGNVGTHVFDAIQMLLGEKAQGISGTLEIP